MANLLPIIPFTREINATVKLPGSKSITNRALIFAALCNGTVKLTGALFSRDTNIMVAALQEIGFSVETNEADKTIVVKGQGGVIPKAKAAIFVGNAGTAARFLTALLALHPKGEYTMDGDPAMHARPMGGLIQALSSQGTKAVAPDGTPTDHFPFTLHTRGLRGGEIAVDASASSQLLSALLMVAPFTKKPATVRLAEKTVSEPFVEMTLRMCADFGREATTPSEGIYVFDSQGAYSCPSGTYPIEPDATAASYFLALPIASPAKIKISGLRSNGLQGDAGFAKILQELGLPFRKTKSGWEVSSPDTPLRGGYLDFNAISDTFLTLAAIAPLLASPLTIRGIAHARKQETDRLLAMATELTKLRQTIDPPLKVLRKDTSIGMFTIYPNRKKLKKASRKGPVNIQTYEDHRIAMSFGILGTYDLYGDGRPWLKIRNPACCGKTFPGFFQVLEGLR
ncbi:MAG: 3-phosphoshikimate 1-carboxyvinyltransferase [Puniceicoccales bacterium]|jgi:3-phosphoshikimate 1-carboxyvinyltransferase|nr:3-phosphoshikimate 1-carboxyvinyltransferase [Puniceicoccales bacterium]